MKFKMCGEKVFILAVMLILASVVSADIYIRDNFMFGDVSQQRFCPYIGSLSFSSENTGQFNLLDNSLTFEESSALDRCGVYNTIIAADDNGVPYKVAPAPGLMARCRIFLGDFSNGFQFGFSPDFVTSDFFIQWYLNGYNTAETNYWAVKESSNRSLLRLGKVFGALPSNCSFYTNEYPMDLMCFVREVTGDDVLVEMWIKCPAVLPSAQSFGPNWFPVGKWWIRASELSLKMQFSRTRFPAISIWYDGSGSANVAVDDHILFLRSGAGTEELNLSSSSLRRLNLLAKQINTLEGWRAVVQTYTELDSDRLIELLQTDCDGWDNKVTLNASGRIRVDEVYFADGADAQDPADGSKWRCVTSTERDTYADNNLASGGCVYVPSRDAFIASVAQGKEASSNRKFGVRLYESTDPKRSLWNEIKDGDSWFLPYSENEYGYHEMQLTADGDTIVGIGTKWFADPGIVIMGLNLGSKVSVLSGGRLKLTEDDGTVYEINLTDPSYDTLGELTVHIQDNIPGWICALSSTKTNHPHLPSKALKGMSEKDATSGVELSGNWRLPVVKVSADGGLNWSDEYFLDIPTVGHSHSIICRPGIRTQSGRWAIMFHDSKFKLYMMWSDSPLPMSEQDWHVQAVPLDDNMLWCEPTICEVDNGELLIVLRDQQNKYAGMFSAVQAPGGFTFDPQVTICDGMAGRPYIPSGKSPMELLQSGDETLLFGPLVPSRSATSVYRDHIAILVSKDQGITWNYHPKSPLWQSQGGAFCYTDFMRVDNGLFGTFCAQTKAVYFVCDKDFFVGSSQ